MQRQGVIISKARQLDLDFLKSILTSSKIHENFGTSIVYTLVGSWDAGPATNTRYRPSIHLTPSNPRTIKTVILEAQALAASSGQLFVVVTADQQLYRGITANI